MPDITSFGAVDRHITEYLTTDKRTKYYKCKTLQNPDYYYNGTLYQAVGPTYKVDTSTIGAGSISLASKGIVSVGVKSADDAYKFIGLRPDEKQNGDEQMEICPELIEINGKSQTIDLSTRTAINSITTRYGTNLYTQAARQRLRVMMGADDLTESFKMSLRLYLTGLKVEYIAALDEYWIFNLEGKFRFRLGKPYLVDPATRNPLCDEFGNPYQNAVKHSLTEVSKGEYLYVKEPDKGFSEIKLPKSFFIDADTVYSSTADGRVYLSTTSSTWANRHDAATGTTVAAAEKSAFSIAGVWYFNPNYVLYRSFFYYALTGLSGTATAVDEKIYGVTNNDSSVCTQLGTQADTLALEDYDSFSGSEYVHAVWSKTGYNTLSYNAQGVSDVSSALGGTFKTCLREYTKDYLNSNPGSSILSNGGYYSNQADTTYDPYLYVTITAAGGSLLLPRRNFKHMIVR